MPRRTRDALVAIGVYNGGFVAAQENQRVDWKSISEPRDVYLLVQAAFLFQAQAPH